MTPFRITSNNKDVIYEYNLTDDSLIISITWKEVPIRRMSLVADRSEAMDLRDWLVKNISADQ